MRRDIIRILRLDGSLMMMLGGVMAAAGNLHWAQYPIWTGMVLLIVALVIDTGQT